MDELIHTSATKLAKAIRDKKVSSKEVVEAYLEQIAAVNPNLNALVQLAADSALTQAKNMDDSLARGESQGPLHGVPMTVKDTLDTAGVVSTWGTPGRKQFVPKHDSTVVARMKAAGAILLGKTNAPEFSFSFDTTNPLYGDTKNPYNLKKTPGGSSGGSAALLAACGTPIELGSDTGGSLRLPAHFCGITAIKPTSGRVPRTGHAVPFGGILDYFTQIGPMARYTEDLALILPIISGYDVQDPATITVNLEDPQKVDLCKLRGLFFTDNGIYSPTPETTMAVETAALKLSETGMEIEEIVPPGIGDTFDIVSGLFTSDGGAWIRLLLERAGTSLEDTSLKDFASAPSMSAEQIVHLIDRWDQFRINMNKFMEPYDFILSPVNSFPALDPGEWVEKWSAFSYTMTHNLTGWPASVVRVATSPEEMPIGVQIAASPWREDIAISVAQRLETEFGGWEPPKIIR
jgi:amidase